MLKTVGIAALFCSITIGQTWYTTGGTWINRKVGAIDHRRVRSTRTDAPVYIQFDKDPDLAGRLRTDCHDFLITLADGTKLDHELRKCDAAAGSVGAMIRVPSVSAVADTPLIVYYNNSSATDQSNTAGVWGSAYKIVIPGGSLTDSTSNHNNATGHGNAPQTVAGVYGSAYAFDGLAGSYLTTATTPVTTAYTLSFWFKVDTAGNTSQLLSPIVAAGNYGLGMPWNTFEPWEGMFIQGFNNGFPAVIAYDQRPAPNKWYYATETWDGSTVSGYLDGRLIGTGSVSILDNPGGLFISGDATSSVRASIGEIRLLNSALTREQVATEAVNYWNPDTFIFAGAQETNVSAVPIVHSFTATYDAVESGKPSDLHWLVSNAASVSIDQGIGSQSALNSGWATIAPASTLTYTLTATNATGASTATVTVSVLTGTIAYPRYGKPSGTWIRSYAADGFGHAVMETWEPHRYVPGDYIQQHGECSSDANVNHASNLNGIFQVASVLDGGHYTIKTLAGADVSPNASWTWCNGVSGNAAIWGGRVIPVTLPAGPKGMLDGKDGVLTRHLWTSTDNGLTSIIVSGGTATITLGFTHDSKVGQTIAVFNSSSSSVNGEHTITGVGTTTIQYTTAAGDGDYTHNDVCGPASGTPNTIGGTANCVVVSQYAFAANPFWARILTDTANFGTPASYKHPFDGGTTWQAADGFGFPFAEAAYRFGVDRTWQAGLDGLVYYVTHMFRHNGANFDAIAFSDEGGAGGGGIGHLWQFDFYADSLPYAVANYLGHLTSGQKTLFADSILNNIEDPTAANQCHQVFPQREVLATGTAQGGSGNTIVLAASDAKSDNYYVNNIVNFSDGSHIFWGLVTGYVASTKTATVGTIVRTTNYTAQDVTTVGSWTTPTSGTVYEIDATATISGNTLTGYNTNWTTSMSVGDAVVAYFSWPASSAPFNEYYFSAIGSDTSATVIVAPQANGTSTPQPVWVIPGFSQSRKDCGVRWRVSWSSGGMGPQPIQYPGVASNSVLSAWHYMPVLNDEGASQQVPALSFAAALADDDARALDWWQEAQSVSMDYSLRFLVGTNGLTENGVHYGYVEEGQGCNNILMLHNTLPASMMSGLESSSFLTSYRAAKQYMILPDLAGGLRHQYVYGANSGGSTIMVEPGTSEHLTYSGDCASLFNSGGDGAKYFKDFLHANGLSGGPAGYTFFLFPVVDPRIPDSTNGGLAYSAQPTQYLISPMASGSALCKAVAGWDQTGPLTCDAQKGDAAISKTSWSSTSSATVMFEARSCCSCCYDAPSGGLLKAYQVGHLLTDDFQIPGNVDYAGVPDQTEKAEMPRFNEANTVRNGVATAYGVEKTYMSRWASNGGSFGPEYGDENSNYMYAQADLTGAYTTTYNHVLRDVADLKKPGTEHILIQYDDIDASNVPPASGIRFGVHYAQNGEAGNATNGLGPEYNEGTTTCPGAGGCPSLNTNRTILSEEDGHAADANGPARTAAIITKWFSPGIITLRDDGAGYSGGNGHTHRVSVCAGSSCGGAAFTMKVITVHKLVDDFNTDTTLTAAPINPDANWTGVQTTDKVALFAGVLQSSMTGFTTTHSGTAQYLFSGLTAGTYTVTVGGSAVSGSPFTVSGGDNTVYFESTAGVVSLNGSAPSSNPATAMGGKLTVGGTVAH